MMYRIWIFIGLVVFIFGSCYSTIYVTPSTPYHRMHLVDDDYKSQTKLLLPQHFNAYGPMGYRSVELLFVKELKEDGVLPTRMKMTVSGHVEDVLQDSFFINLSFGSSGQFISFL